MSSATASASSSQSSSRRYLIIGLVILIVVAVGAILAWRTRGASKAMFVEYPMTVASDIPAALAIGPDGAVWFSIDFSNAVGVLRDGKMQRFTKKGDNVDAIGLGVDAAGNAWYADGPAVAIQKISPTGEMTSFPLGTPIARLARLAVAPDGGVWFAESTSYSVTRLKDGVLTRNPIDSMRGGPFGVAVASDGTAWATLQSANALMRITPSGAISEYEIPTRGSAPSDIAVDGKGGVWFLEFRGNKIGRYADGKFDEFPLPDGVSAISGIAVAPDGSVWFGAMRGGLLGRFKDGKFRLFKLPREDARPFSVAVDHQGNVWYADIRGFVGMLSADQAGAD
jgi:virginiamycin B lyase